MSLLKAVAHLALSRRSVDRTKLLVHNSAAVGLVKQRTIPMTAYVPGLAEMNSATDVGLL